MLPTGEPGVITAISGDRLTIQLTNVDACDECGLQVVCKPGNDDSRSMDIRYVGDFHIGQRVKLVERINLEWRMATIQYVLPLLMFILGLLLFYFIPLQGIAQELWAFLGGCIGLGLSFLLSRGLMERLARGAAKQALAVVPLQNQ